MTMFDIIGLDADDTLWHNETIFSMTQDKFKRLLSPYHSAEWIDQRLFATEMRNLEYFGYGIKGFTLSMIETAIELTEGRIQGSEIQMIIDFAREMRRTPVQLLEHVQEVVTTLVQQYQLMLITKGDLLDQESKIAQSGLADYFRHIEIISEKTEAAYAAILAKYGIPPERFLMVGNSLKSDILPVVAIGGQAVHIPYHITWSHEVIADAESRQQGYVTLEHIGLLPALVEQMQHG